MSRSFGPPFQTEFNDCMVTKEDSCAPKFQGDVGERYLYFNGRAFENLGSLVENLAVPVSFLRLGRYMLEIIEL